MNRSNLTAQRILRMLSDCPVCSAIIDQLLHDFDPGIFLTLQHLLSSHLKNHVQSLAEKIELDRQTKH